MYFAVLAMGLSLTQGALGTELRRDGYGFRPPEGFRLERMARYAGSRVGAVAVDPGEPRFLSAALADGEGLGAATLLVAVVEDSFSASPSARDAFGAAVVRHFERELGLALVPERVERLGEPVARVEVLGTVREAGQVRTVLVAGLASEGRHAVVTVSAPAERWEALAPEVRASLETFRMETARVGVVSREVAGAVAGALGGALVVSYTAWRRRQRAREQENEPPSPAESGPG